MNASLVDLGHRFRLLVNVVDGVKVEQPMPKRRSPVCCGNRDHPFESLRKRGFWLAERIIPSLLCYDGRAFERLGGDGRH